LFFALVWLALISPFFSYFAFRTFFGFSGRSRAGRSDILVMQKRRESCVLLSQWSARRMSRYQEAETGNMRSNLMAEEPGTWLKLKLPCTEDIIIGDYIAG
jgi:hypothetical protein